MGLMSGWNCSHDAVLRQTTRRPFLSGGDRVIADGHPEPDLLRDLAAAVTAGTQSKGWTATRPGVRGHGCPGARGNLSDRLGHPGPGPARASAPPP